ncbi:MAG: hypothetical protein U0Q15_00020 [Kineosporiaceae bacterium]
MASGATSLWSRTSNGDLYRTQFDSASGRLLATRTKYNSGFNAYATILSPGYDVLYGITSTGSLQISKFNYSGSTSSWVLNKFAAPFETNATPITSTYIWMANTFCSAPTDVPVAQDLNPPTAGSPGRPPAAVQWQAGTAPGQVDVLHVNGAGQLILTSYADANLSGVLTRKVIQAGNYVAVAAAKVEVGAAGTPEAEYSFAQTPTGHIVRISRSDAAAAFVGQDMLGLVSGAPSAVRRSDNSAAVVASHAGGVWGSFQLTNLNEFGPWERLQNATGNAPVLVGDVTAAPLDNGIVAVVGRSKSDNTVQLGLWDPKTHVTNWSRVTPTLAASSTPAVASYANRLRIAVRTSTGGVATLKQTVTGAWEGTWTQITDPATADSTTLGFAGYEGIWYLVARRVDEIFVGKESGPGAGMSATLQPTTVPLAEGSSSLGADPAFFTLRSAGGADQAALALVNGAGYASAVKLNTNLNPAVRPAGSKQRSAARNKATPSSSPQHH